MLPRSSLSSSVRTLGPGRRRCQTILVHTQLSTSCVENVVEQPAPAPAVTVVGGSSQAPIRSAAPVSITSHKPMGITYSKALTLPMQSTSGSSSSKAPFNMEKERKFLKEVSIRPTAEPIHAMHKIMEEQGKELDVALGKHREFMTFAANSSPVQNAVASSSKAPEVPVEPSLQEILAHAPSFKSMKEFDEYEKKQRTRSKKAKKAKKESVHLPIELQGTETTNVQVFPETQVGSKEPLDWGTPSTQDDESYDSLSEELAATAGITHLSLTPAPSTRSSKGKGKRKEKRFGEDDQDNNPDSHAYDDYGYNRLVSTNFTIYTVTKDEKLQLLNSLSSIEHRVELICNKCSSTTKCVRCKT